MTSKQILLVPALALMVIVVGCWYWIEVSQPLPHIDSTKSDTFFAQSRVETDPVKKRQLEAQFEDQLLKEAPPTYDLQEKEKSPYPFLLITISAGIWLLVSELRGMRPQRE